MVVVPEFGDSMIVGEGLSGSAIQIPLPIASNVMVLVQETV
ncbi:hypothetical protein FVB9532_03241 [Mesonia oceanica]|uniref:Uncharacterized protein n=1 Tax=Mesonia oceanica TaxID=2687242 RepID=A0AC61YBT9_9FLAO|nr:hypothetical protein FVB9532_03241 [Mesonia oceanica]